MDPRFCLIVCVVALAGTFSTTRADPPAAPAASPAPAEAGEADAKARAEARVKERETEAQIARSALGRALSDSKYDPAAPAVTAAMSKASEAERRLQYARDDWDRLRGDPRFLINEAQQECVIQADNLARARKALSDTRAKRGSEAELAAAVARVAATQKALSEAQARLVALPIPTEPATRPDYFERRLAQAADHVELMTQGAKLTGEAASEIEATGDPVQIGLAYERASRFARLASDARDEQTHVRALIDAARPVAPPKAAEPRGGGGPTIQPPR